MPELASARLTAVERELWNFLLSESEEQWPVPLVLYLRSAGSMVATYDQQREAVAQWIRGSPVEQLEAVMTSQWRMSQWCLVGMAISTGWALWLVSGLLTRSGLWLPAALFGAMLGMAGLAISIVCYRGRGPRTGRRLRRLSRRAAAER